MVFILKLNVFSFCFNDVVDWYVEEKIFCLHYIEISKKNILSLEEFYDGIYSFISTIITENTNVYCNPRLDNGIIFGDADLIINNEIMDFKTSYQENINIEYTLQLLIYTALGRSKGIEINKISVYNPLCGVYYYATSLLFCSTVSLPSSAASTHL